VDIWAWITATEATLREAGHERLADLLDEIPTAVCDDEHARADALVPEAVALARELRLPWVELFLRHWHLQSRVLHRLEVRGAQGESVSLLDFAHREETRECPQAICVVQDFAACHGLIDGPGFATERIGVCKETLARIGPRWPCFVCISGELADALVDAGDAEGSLALVHAQRAAMQAAGVRVDDQLVSNEVLALIELDRPAEALAVVDRVLHRYSDDHTRNARKLLRAHALARLGRLAEASAALPLLEVVRETASHWQRWALVIEALVEGDAYPNDAELAGTLGSMLTQLADQGVLRGALEIGRIHAGLALARGAPETALEALAVMERLVPGLRAPASARAQLDTLQRAITNPRSRTPK
jgi:hypothetical protein